MCYNHEQRDVQQLINKIIEKNEKARGLFNSIFIDTTPREITIEDILNVRNAYWREPWTSS